MAQIKNSPFEGMRGTLGDLVFRTWNGKTHVYAKSTKPRPQSEAQKKNRDKFREASFKATLLLSDATLYQHYMLEAKRKQLPNAYTAALRELLGS